MLLMLLTALAHAGDLDLDVRVGGERAFVSVRNAAPCQTQYFLVEDEAGTWDIEVTAAGMPDGQIYSRVQVRRWTPERRFEAAPMIVSLDGETAQVKVGDAYTIDLTATGMEVGRCLPRDLVDE